MGLGLWRIHVLEVVLLVRQVSPAVESQLHPDRLHPRGEVLAESFPVVQQLEALPRDRPTKATNVSKLLLLCLVQLLVVVAALLTRAPVNVSSSRNILIVTLRRHAFAFALLCFAFKTMCWSARWNRRGEGL